MEHLVLGLVLLSRTLDSASPRHRRDLDPVKVLDMAPSSFDDQYQGCSRMMEEELQELNQTEFASNRVYNEAWSQAIAEWQSKQHHVSRVPALRLEHVVTLLAYTQDSPLYLEFNAAVRVAGRSREEYLNTFHFKVLHFLLSEALRILRDAQPQKCHNVYRGVDIRFTARHHQSIRFGQFTSTSLQKDKAWQFGQFTSTSLWKGKAWQFDQGTFFLVETCYGVLIRNFSVYPDEEEVLIPPFEIFKVTNITHNGNRTIIQLRSQGASSTYNCEWVKGRSIHGEPPCLWGLFLAATALAAATGS
ncbi:erythroblast NAD(P)(+)--arginine ADP-ribosyltransferase-like [Balearica regulorum gibbericeps]|uniref:erythroblast NAD(P)(+)--arginine ADP-ribosyltransferase-like n=1 Tax=Balearica regulorum gibbericeps TaxID=100784 RepID=UPI003F600A02